MEIITLNGEIVKLKLRDRSLKEESRSKFQYSIGQQLKQLYPHDRIYEEVFVPVENIIFDFFIPSRKLVIECQGIQHHEHIKFFHTTKQSFHKQQDRDQKKRDLCLLNGFKLMEIDYE